MENLRVLPLHKHKEYVSDCVKLLNSEWPRSETLRLKSIQSSCDSLPTYMVMVYTLHDAETNSSNGCEAVGRSECTTNRTSVVLKERNGLSCSSCSSNHKEVVVGHSKISRLWSIPEGCFVESVVIHKEYRGKGWGKFLMDKVEQFIKQLGGIKIIYLTTLDKQSFYNKIGYKETEPIPLFGGSLAKNSFDINSALGRLLLSKKSSSPARPVIPRSDFTHSCGYLRSNNAPKPVDLIIPDEHSCTKSSNNINSRFVPQSAPEIDSANLLPLLQCSPPQPPPLPLFGDRCKQEHKKKGNLTDSKKTFMMKLVV